MGTYTGAEPRLRSADRHKNKGDRHKLPYSQRRISRTVRPTTRDITTLAIDGEGEDVSVRDASTGERVTLHYYTFLAGADRTGKRRYSVANPAGLSSVECFEFLLSLPRHSRKVGFSIGYDINKWLRDIPHRYLLRLWDTKRVWWNGYHIQWTPNKVFSVSKHGRKCVVWDMFGYFQKSFARTLDEWEVGTPEQRELIASMKAQRAGFANVDDSEIHNYCFLECELACQVFDKLLDCCNNLDLKLRRYDGAGSIAAAMLRKHNVQAFSESDGSLPKHVVLSAYYGGRFDYVEYGEIGTCFEYDINSAYPYACTKLPCLTCGTWLHETPVSEWDNGYILSSYGVYHVEWNLPPDRQWAPFPYREGSSIEWYQQGRGWYYKDEVIAAIRLYGPCITILEAYHFVPSCEHKPFAFIPEYFEQRRQLKARGDLSQMVIKLGLNSLYGKTAQSKGEHIPPHQSFIWAGMITSYARSMLLEALRLASDNAVLMATDALITKQPIPLNTGSELGDWEPKTLHNLFIVQNGVYLSGEEKVASRGFNPRDINFDAIRERARTDDHFKHHFIERGFIGLGEALQASPPLRHWGQWIERKGTIEYGASKGKRLEGHRLYPGENPHPEQDSTPFDPAIMRYPDDRVFRVEESESCIPS